MLAPGAVEVRWGAAALARRLQHQVYAPHRGGEEWSATGHRRWVKVPSGDGMVGISGIRSGSRDLEMKMERGSLLLENGRRSDERRVGKECLL